MASLAAVLLCRPHRPQDRRHHGSSFCPPQQGCWHLWPYRCPYRRRRLLCSAQSLHLLSHCPPRTHMGSTGSQRRALYFLPLFSLTHPSYRRIQDRPSTLPTFLPQTMSSQLPGPSFLLLSGGSGRPMTVDVRQTRQHRRP